jgi:carboxylate-amine ligase
MGILPFASSTPFSLGVKLELQLVEHESYKLATGAHDLLARIDSHHCRDRIRPDIALGMVEMKSGVHDRADLLMKELEELRSGLIKSVERMNIEIAGGGAHPFHCLSDECGASGQSFQNVHERYCHRARTSAVFGQHVYVGVSNGDDALYLTHGFSRFVPHFIALSAASPFYKGRDTKFDSSRSDVARTFPLSGTVPCVTRWREFESCYDELRQIGIINSMRDFYWDVRPKPEHGTVEIRVCDTPLTLEHAALLACYVQLLARWLIAERPYIIDENFYSLYQANRFAASRYGLHGEITMQQSDAEQAVSKQSIFSSVLECLNNLKRYAENETDLLFLKRLRQIAHQKMNDACRLRDVFKQRNSFKDVMQHSSQLWMTQTPSLSIS